MTGVWMHVILTKFAPVVNSSVVTVFLILTVKTFLLAIAHKVTMKAGFCVPFSGIDVAFDASHLGIRALILVTVHASRHLVDSVRALQGSTADEDSIDAV